MTSEPSAPGDRATAPKLAALLARVATNSLPFGDTALGDLAEERLRVAARRGRVAANLWYWLQALALAAHGLGRVMRGGLRVLATLLFIGDRPMSTLLQEVRVALRALARYPLVTATIVLTLAIGLGVNAAAFSLLDALVLRPFNLKDVDRLALVSEYGDREPFPRESVSPANFLDWKAQARSFDRMAVFAWWQVNLASGSEPERVQGFRVSSEYFSTLGIAPAAGRFIEDRDMTGDGRVVVLSDGLWRRRFAARPDIVGQTVRIDGEAYEVVGIAPPDFNIPMGSVLWGAWRLSADEQQDRRARYLTVVARLAPGCTLEQAESEMAVIGDRLLTQYPRENEDLTVRVQSFSAGLIDPGLDQILGMIQIGALLVLAIGGANIANLLLARFTDRQREIALRLAIGAGRARLLRQLLVESAVLAAIAVPVSLAFAAGALQLLVSAMPDRIIPFVPGWHNIDIDPRLIVVISVTAVVASVAVTIFPALHSSRPNLAASLKEGGRTVAGGRSGRAVRNALVVGQIAVAVPLLVATGLTASAANQYAHGPQGYQPDGVATLRTVLPEATFPETAQRRQFAQRFIERVQQIPGVTSAATSSAVPSGDTSPTRELIIDGRADEGPGRRPFVPYRVVSAGYFATLRIPLLEGREFDATDSADAAPTAVISRTLANQLFPGEPAIGKRVRIADTQDQRWITIVGVSGTIIDDWFNRRHGPMFYMPMPQRPTFAVNLVARSDGNVTTLASELRDALRDVDPAQPPVHVMSMSKLVQDRTTGLQMIGAMMGGLGVLALILAAIGLFGLMSYQVRQRRHEIGVRMALGASRRGVVRMTIRRASWLAGIGVAVGLVPAILLSGVIRNVMFGVVTPGPALYAVIVIAIVGIAMLASLIPARQASQVDPALALRGD